MLLEVLELFTGFEAYGSAWGDVDLFAGAWVAADAGLARLDSEDAEAPQFDAVAVGERALHGCKDGVHGGFCLITGQSCAFHDALDEVLLDQAGTPFG